MASCRWVVNSTSRSSRQNVWLLQGGRILGVVFEFASNTKEQFANSPDLKTELIHAIIDALVTHTSQHHRETRDRMPDSIR